MKIILGSNNEPKRLAVSNAFQKAFPDTDIVVETVSADSGVSSHPLNGSETLQGALNRAAHARQQKPGADFYVGVEGGLIQIDDRTWLHGLIAVSNAEGETYTGVSAGVELRGILLVAAHEGRELNESLHEHFELKDIGKANGFYGLVSNDVVTREDAYIQAIIFALAPFNHPEYFQ